MQALSGPDLPHTRTRPVHWMATGVALAVTVGAGALVQPAGATTPDAAPTRSAPDAAAVHYPLRCGTVPVDVVATASADLDGDGRSETVAVVRCAAATGSPPSGVYVLTPGAVPGAAPRVTATLVDPAGRLLVKDLRITGRTVSALVFGYSSDAVPRCCPDRERSFSWVWRDGRFRTVPGPHAGSV